MAINDTRINSLMFNIMLKTFLTTFILLLACFLFLLNGVKIDSLSFDNFKIKQLYLKYDKNLILHLDNFEILDDKDDSLIVNINTVLHLSYDGGTIKKLNISNIDVALTGILKFNLIDSLWNKDYRFSIYQLDFMFEPKLPHLKAKFVDFNYLNNEISLIFNEPTCDNIKLDGSTAVIKNITTNDSKLIVNLKSKSLLEKNLLKILSFYGVDLPIYQTIGKNDILTELVIPFNDNPIKIYTRVKSKDTSITFKDIAIPITNLNIEFKDNNITTNINIDNLGNKLNITNFMNLNTNKLHGEVKIEKFKYKNKVAIDNTFFDYYFDKNENIFIVPKLGLYYSKVSNNDYVYIRYLNKIIKYITFLDTIGETSSDIYINSKNNFKTTDINIHDLNIKVDDSYFKNDDSDEKDKTILPNMNVNSTNGKIVYKNFNFKYNEMLASIKDSTLDFKYTNKDTNIFISTDIDSENIQVTSEKISDTVFNEVLQKDFLKDGFLKLNIYGTFDKIAGKITFHETMVQNVQILNNLITFINTTPAIINPILALPTLFRLGQTNFDMQGYYIKNGKCEFNYDIEKNLINIDNLRTKGTMMDFNAKGTIDINSEILNINTNVIFMKDYSKVLNNIPLVGYVIVGDDGNFVTQIDITNTIDNPEFETHTIKNVSTGVVNIIKRIITLPLQPFKNIKQTKEEAKDHQRRVDEMINPETSNQD